MFKYVFLTQSKKTFKFIENGWPEKKSFPVPQGFLMKQNYLTKSPELALSHTMSSESLKNANCQKTSLKRWQESVYLWLCSHSA